MKLSEYLEPRGRVNELAGQISVPAALVSQWKTCTRVVPAERCIEIERASGGAVRCEDLRPDVDWAYLRATDCDVKLGADETAHDKLAA